MWMMLQDEKLSDGVKKATLENMDEILQIKPFEATSVASEEITDEKVMALIAERNLARQQKNYARSDEIRQQLSSMGIEIKDSPTGVTFSRKR